MAKTKKTKKEEVVETIELKNSFGDIKLLEAEKFKECEWCFQFDEDEPQIFAWTGDDSDKEDDPKVIFTITNTKDSYISFTHKNGKTFKLFARELSDDGKQLRTKQTELTKLNLQNESESKEA